jgi:hypothetical protein
MSYSNFTNGSLVFRIWRFDGGCEILAKFQYRVGAEMFAEAICRDDEARGSNKGGQYFYIAVCENEAWAKAFGAKKDATS